MKRVLMALMFVVFVGISAFAEDNIAVFPFKNKVQDDYGLTELAETEMSALLVSYKRFNVIERKEIDKILQEQHFSNSGIVDINEALQIGKVKGIKYGVFGEITNASWSAKDVASSSFQLKIVDMETADVKLSKVYNMQSQEKKDADKKAAFANMLKEKIKKEVSNDLVNAFTIEGSIVDVNGKKVTIDMGSKQGVIKGMEFNVMESKEKIGKNGKKVKVEKARALLEVTEVHDETAVCKFKDGEKLEEGMTVKLVQVDENRYYKAEDIEKILARRGFNKGDLMIDGFIGIGSPVFTDYVFPHQESVDYDLMTIKGGARALYFLSSWFGIGLEFNVSNSFDDGEGRKIKPKNATDENETYMKTAYSDQTVLVAGRVNLSNSATRIYVPFGLGMASVKQSADRVIRTYDEHQSSHVTPLGKVEQNESVFAGYLGIGLEFNVTNHVSLGLEARYNIVNTSNVAINTANALFKIGYKFDEVF